MLKHSYDSQESIPENIRGAYVLSGGKWLLDELSDDHPVIVKNKEVLRDKSKAVSKAEELQADLDNARGSSIPRGHVAVAKSDADLLEKVKAHGSGDEVVAKLTEHKTLKEQTEQRAREDNLRQVAKALSYEPEAFVRLQNLPEFEIRGEGDKKTVVAKLKDDKGVITEKPAQEFVESSSDFAPFLPALKAQGNGTRVHGSSGSAGQPAKDLPTRIREQVQQEAKHRQAEIHPMFKQIPGRVTASTGE
jgi:hypothetical protein